jgi:2-polyprenyl-6-methoxyphenol hydroxylase-like FAD-dependent oxidoreductase
MTTSHELSTNGTVAIVGAGPAGLTLARLLQMRGFTVRIYERDASATSRPQGGSLDLRPSLGQRAIQAAGLTAVFEAASRRDATDFKLLDGQGNVIPGAGGETHEDAGPEIDRGTLRRLLIESLEPGTIHWGHAATDVVRRDDGKWSIRFAGQPTVVADLVVGADGIGSKVRGRLTQARPVYTGHTMLAANIRRDLWRGSRVSDLVGEGSVMIAGHHKTMFLQRCADDLILIYYSLKVAEDWPAAMGFGLDNTAATLAAVRAAYSDFAPEVLSMTTDIEGAFARWPLSVMPPDYAWDAQPGLTMLGDASHGMPPFTGKGVNLAMFDAMELAAELTAHPGEIVRDAVAAFEARMQARTRVETGACLDVGRNYYGITVDFREPAVA